MQRKTRNSGKINQKKIAVERIEILLNSADSEALSGNLVRADRNVNAARRIAMKYNARIPGELKRKFCKFCYCYLLPQATSSVKLNSDERRVEVKCASCGKVMFYPYAREIKKKRREKRNERIGERKLKNN